MNPQPPSQPDAVTPRYGLPTGDPADTASLPRVRRDEDAGAKPAPTPQRRHWTRGAFIALIVLVLILIAVIIAQAMGAFRTPQEPPPSPVTPPSITLEQTPPTQPEESRTYRPRRTRDPLERRSTPTPTETRRSTPTAPAPRPHQPPSSQPAPPRRPTPPPSSPHPSKPSKEPQGTPAPPSSGQHGPEGHHHNHNERDNAPARKGDQR